MAMQPEVRPPSAGALRERFPDMRMLHARDGGWLDMVGRLREGTSVAKAAAALDVVGRRLQAAYPESNRDISARLWRARTQAFGSRDAVAKDAAAVVRYSWRSASSGSRRAARRAGR